MSLRYPMVKAAYSSPKNDFHRTILVLVAAAVFSTFPTFLIPGDFWDGTLISYAVAERDLSTLKVWFFTSGHPFMYYLQEFTSWLSNASGASFPIIIRLTTAVAILGVTVEAYLFSRNVVRLDEIESRGVGLFVLFFPAWHVLVSSVLTMHILCVWWVLLGFRLCLSQNKIYLIPGLSLILVSFTLNSNFSFVVGLAIAVVAAQWLRGTFPSRVFVLKNSCIVILAIIGFGSLKTFFPPTGIYQGYNSIVFPTSLSEISQTLKVSFQFFKFSIFFTLILGALVLPLAFFALGRQHKETAQLLRLVRQQLAASRTAVIVASILWAFAALPYVAVQKAPGIIDFADWGARHGLLLALPLALLHIRLGCGAAYVLANNPAQTRTFCRIVITGLVFASAVALYKGYTNKAVRSAYESAIVEAFRSSKAPPDGKVHISATDTPPARYRLYEVNWLLYRAYGRASWHATLDNRASVTAEMLRLPQGLGKGLGPVSENPDQLFAILMMKNYKETGCLTKYRLLGNAGSGFSAWLWTVGLRKGPILRLQELETFCPPSGPRNLGRVPADVENRPNLNSS